MSALLQLTALQFDISKQDCSDARSFSGRIAVTPPHGSKSTLFMVYQQKNELANRIQPNSDCIPQYRNHYALYRNADSLLIVRTETTLYLSDNDAVLEYDCVYMSNNLNDRLRSKYDTWCISFDKCIRYESTCPDISKYTLISCGEWWYYDKGVILNGLTSYSPESFCMSLLIYYEFHQECRITFPPRDNDTITPSAIKTITRHLLANNNPINALMSRQMNRMLPLRPAQPAVTNQAVPLPPSNEPPPNTPINPVDQLASTTTPAQQTPPSLNNLSFEQLINVTSNTRNSNTTQLAFDARSGPRIPEIPTNEPVSLQVSTLPSNTASIFEAINRPIRTDNDATTPTITQVHSVIPSLHWFTKVTSELRRGSIESFIPTNFVGTGIVTNIQTTYTNTS